MQMFLTVTPWSSLIIVSTELFTGDRSLCRSLWWISWFDSTTFLVTYLTICGFTIVSLLLSFFVTNLLSFYFITIILELNWALALYGVQWRMQSAIAKQHTPTLFNSLILLSNLNILFTIQVNLKTFFLLHFLSLQRLEKIYTLILWPLFSPEWEQLGNKLFSFQSLLLFKSWNSKALFRNASTVVILYTNSSFFTQNWRKTIKSKLN